jgi:hypothetical protein
MPLPINLINYLENRHKLVEAKKEEEKQRKKTMKMK